MPRRRHTLALALGAALAAAVSLAAGPVGSAHGAADTSSEPSTDRAAGDLLLPDYSLESGGSGWTFGHARSVPTAPATECAAAATVTSEQHVTGTHALKLAPSRACKDPAALSGAVPATAGNLYAGFAHSYVDGSAGPTSPARPQLRLVFRDTAGKVLMATTSSEPAARRSTGWAPGRVLATAPSGTATVAVEAVAASRRTAYVDDVLVSAQETNLGAQITSAALNAVTFGHDAMGKVTAYGVVTGNDTHDAELIGVDPATGVISTDLELPGATGAWAAAVATDGTVYVGSYNYDDLTKGGRLYSYVPGAATVTDLGTPIAGDTFVFGLTAGPDGAVFGGDYPSGGAFRYTPGAGFSQLGARPVVSPEQYARSLAYDPSNGIAYVGIGSHAHLMACPDGGTACTDILPSQYSNEEFAYSVSAGDGYVFVNLSPSGNGHLVVLKVTRSGSSVTASVVTDIPSVKYPGASGVNDGKVYYADDSGEVWSYDIAANATADLGVHLAVTPRAWGFDPAGSTLFTMGGRSGVPAVQSYDIAAGTLSTVAVQNPPKIPTDLQSIQTGPDGGIYSSGFRSPAVGVYTPIRSDQTVTYSGISQAEGSTVIGDTIYWGTYPGAIVYGYTPSQPWAAGTNPKTVCTLTDADQDRPYGMTGSGGKLYIGTEAGYGKLQGALSVYDPGSGSCTVLPTIVPDQTVASLTSYKGVVYGGTSIYGGLGIDPTQTDAKLIAYDTATGRGTAIPLPDKGLRTVLGLTVGPDRRIWMVAEDRVLAFDPAKKRFVVDKQIFPELDIRSAATIDAHDAFLTVGRDGALYGTIHDAYLYRLDPRTLRTTILVRGRVHSIQTDAFGNLYYVQNGYELHRYVIAKK